jgi:hypothetical protein
MLVIGCDPGLTGAISLIGSGALLECEDLPVCANGMSTGSMKSWLDVPRFWNLMADWSARHSFASESVRAVIERPIAMPNLPAQTIASQFDTFGVLRSVLACRMREPLVFVTPNEWKKHFGLHREKDASRRVAVSLYPSAPVGRVKDHNRAESILIAHWYLGKHA